MKKYCRFCPALLLIAALLLPTLRLPAAALSAPVIPVINIEGVRDVEVWLPDGTHYDPTDEKADALVDEAISELAPEFAKALLTDNYDEWSRLALEKLTPIYDEIRPAPDGTLPEGTGPYTADVIPASLDALPSPESVGSYYGYAWDYRKSPLDAADELNEYILAVKRKTGAEKVAVASRCGSTPLGAAYLYKYGTEHLSSMVFACSTTLGAPHVDAVMSGNVEVPASALYYYLAAEDPLSSMEERIVKFIKGMLYTANINGSADEIIPVVMGVYEKIKDSFIAPFLRSYYGIGGNYAAMVCEHYEEYRDYIFPTEELKAEYASILAKADEYHYGVQANLRELFADAEAAGVPIYVLAFYGEPCTYPVSAHSKLTGDSLLDLNLQSFGATVGDYPETLPDYYVAAREAQGIGRYISPDRQVDTSTCMQRERTWIIKNMRHEFFLNDLHGFIRLLTRSGGMTVDSDPAYPQFLTVVGNHEGLAPAQAVNERDIDPASYDADLTGTEGFLARMAAFYARIIGFFAGIIRGIKAMFVTTRAGIR